MQERRNSSALVMELRLSCTNPSISGIYVLFTDYSTVFELIMVSASEVFNWLRPRQDGCLCADSIFRRAFFNESFFTLILQDFIETYSWMAKWQFRISEVFEAIIFIFRKLKKALCDIALNSYSVIMTQISNTRWVFIHWSRSMY